MTAVARFFKTVWYVLTLRCEEADRIRANYDDPAVTRAQKAGERMHTALCGSCRAARKSLRQIQRSLEEFEQAAEPTPMPDAARRRIVERLRNAD